MVHSILYKYSLVIITYVYTFVRDGVAICAFDPQFLFEHYEVCQLSYERVRDMLYKKNAAAYRLIQRPTVY